MYIFFNDLILIKNDVFNELSNSFVYNVKSLSNDKLYVYLAIIPEPFIAEGYKVVNVSNTKQYEETPTLIKITNDKTLKQFVDILDVMMTSKNINKKI